MHENTGIGAELLGDATGEVEHGVRSRAVLGLERERRHDDHIVVALQKHRLQEPLDRVARGGVGLAARLLREPVPEIVPEAVAAGTRRRV